MAWKVNSINRRLSSLSSNFIVGTQSLKSRLVMVNFWKLPLLVEEDDDATREEAVEETEAGTVTDYRVVGSAQAMGVGSGVGVKVRLR